MRTWETNDIWQWTNWEPWFAWYPVRLTNKSFRWLVKVYRKRTGMATDSYVYKYGTLFDALKENRVR